MITTFYGTQKSKNCSPQIMAACAFELAYAFSRKTLILQFYSKYPIEDIFIGKQQGAERIELMDNDETGIETLLRKARSGGLTPEHFDTYTKPIISGAGNKNILDVATVPSLADFQVEVIDRKNDVEKLLETAKEIYDDILILADGKDAKLVAMLSGFSEKKVVCIPQDNTHGINSNDEKTLYVVPEFDNTSLYNEKKLKKQYGIKQLFKVPYCVNFKDACLTRNMLKFMAENNSKTDEINGVFINSIRNLAAAIIGENANDLINVGITQLDLKNIPHIPLYADKMEITPEQVHIDQKKKHFWSRKKTVVSIDKEGPHEDEPTGNHAELFRDEAEEDIDDIMQEDENHIYSEEFTPIQVDTPVKKTPVKKATVKKNVVKKDSVTTASKPTAKKTSTTTSKKKETVEKEAGTQTEAAKKTVKKSTAKAVSANAELVEKPKKTVTRKTASAKSSVTENEEAVPAKKTTTASRKSTSSTQNSTAKKSVKAE